MSITTNIIKGTAKGVLSTIPGASILVSIAEEIHGGILQERFDDWKESVELRLRMLTDMQLKQLPKNEIFATVLLLSAQYAIKTNKAKRVYLANAVKSAASTELPEERVVILLGCFERYTIEHLRLLRFLYAPTDYHPNDDIYMGSPISIYNEYYPERVKDLDGVIVRDLYNDGLINTNSLNATMTGRGCLEKRTTRLGDDMIKFFGIEILE